jgi:hypothetical protein
VGEYLNKQGLAKIQIDVPLAKMFNEGEALNNNNTMPVGGEYEVGCYQPAVVALDRNGKALFSWSSVARASNFGGAAGRPRAKEVWEAVSTSLAGDFSQANWHPPSTYNTIQSKIPLQVLYLCLMANGNFISPKFFVFDQHGNGSVKYMMLTAWAKIATAGITIGSTMAMKPETRIPLAVGIASWGLLMRHLYGEKLSVGFKADVEEPEEIKALLAQPKARM